MGTVITVELVGTRGREQLARDWKGVVENDMRVIGLKKGMARIRDLEEKNP